VKTCVAIRHVAFEDAGLLGDILAERGFVLTYLEAGVDDITADAVGDADLLAVLGGPIGAYEDDIYPFLADELRVIGARLQAERPMIGLCLGAQLMARALGARVYPNPCGKEIGWSEVSLTETGRCSPLAELTGVPVLHWHGDTFDLPHGAELLASTPVTHHQAFSWGLSALALQFHPEVTAKGLERWYIGHAAEIAHTPDISVPELRAAASLAAPRLQHAGRAMLAGWLDRVCA
jgi:GMP synthase (glutamine-hydrolysing)